MKNLSGDCDTLCSEFFWGGAASNLPPGPLSGYFDNCFGTYTFKNDDEYFSEPLENKHFHQCGQWTPHDLRRAIRTGLSACRIAPHIPKLAIGHRRQGLNKHMTSFNFVMKSGTLWKHGKSGCCKSLRTT
jgi:hypothetical protein